MKGYPLSRLALLDGEHRAAQAPYQGCDVPYSAALPGQTLGQSVYLIRIVDPETPRWAADFSWA